MAVQTSTGLSARSSRLPDPVKAKERRQKLILAAGSVVLGLVLVMEVPALLKHSSSAVTASPPATVQPVQPTTTTTGTSSVATPASTTRGQAHDLFAPQVGATGASGAAGSTGSAGPVISKGPAVRSSGFVAKDLFAAQVAPTSSATGTTSTTTKAPGVTSSPPPSTTAAAAGFIVVIGSIPASAAAADQTRAEVAALNAGLKHVEIISPSAASGNQYIIALGPYKTLTAANGAKTRAVAVGYAHAYTRRGPKPTQAGP